MVEVMEHGTEDLIESYTMGKLDSAEAAKFEEHLLICEFCRDQAEHADGLRRAMRQALREPFRKDPAWVVTPLAGWLAALLRRPVWMAVPALLALLAIGIFSGGRASLPAVAVLQLTANRGEMPKVGPSHELELRFAGVPPGDGPYRMEVVDARGQRVWSTLTGRQEDAVEARVQAQLHAGDYFVRLYDAGGVVLREYGFAVHD